jgi:hypothetical protein
VLPRTPLPCFPLAARSSSAAFVQAAAMNRHTILLVQPTGGKASRTFSDYENVHGALDGVCSMFEKRLKELNPQMRSITYDINDLYHYIDTLPDLSALVFAPGAQSCGTAAQP